MKCPACLQDKTRVVKTRDTRRWRVCDCGHRFGTVEELAQRIQLQPTNKAHQGRPAVRREDDRPARCRIEDLREARELGLNIYGEDAEGLRR